VPPGEYTVTSSGHTWTGLKSGRTDYVFDEPPRVVKIEAPEVSFDRLWQALDRSYVYFLQKSEVDWNKLRLEFRPRAAKAKSADELAAIIGEMLAKLRDERIWIELPDGKTILPYRTEWKYNMNRSVVQSELTDVTEFGSLAIIGKTKKDGFGYLQIIDPTAATPELMANATSAMEKLAEVPGFIIDLRTAQDGDRRQIVSYAWSQIGMTGTPGFGEFFCSGNVLYSKYQRRDGPEHDAFSEDQPLELRSRPKKAFLKPVVCLLGPGCALNGETYAMMFAALPNVTTVGSATRGWVGGQGLVPLTDACHVYFSRWIDRLPDGTPLGGGQGLQPTIRVDQPSDAHDGADPTFAKGLEVLRDKIAGKK
jgi:peptidase S41-like protein/tricorn protease-like protein